ncbi:MAG: hypothetical protein CMK78_01210 [Pseudomonadales bacterium]|jgi:hypothetical protein|nr:hypothetical protein [Pseudomonadales bacterium]|tara:strand:+ start:79 stop:762 length:684 start_codon:yes stop_codon:yes gene_type:complete
MAPTDGHEREITMKIRMFLAATTMTPALAIAQQHEPFRGATTGLMPFILVALIVYSTRKMAIGGWLFYFYIGLILGPIITAILIYPVIGEYFQPSLWYDLQTYWLAFFSAMPALFASLVVSIFAVRLLFASQRNRRNTMLLRYALLGQVTLGIIGAVIDLLYFPEDIILSVIALIPTSITCLYFFLSQRVKYVLENWNGHWNYNDFVNRNSTLANTGASWTESKPEG